MIVAVAIGRQGIDTLLVISQVVLSVVLPFVMFPLIWLTSSSVVMRVRKPRVLVRTEMTTASKTMVDVGDEKIEDLGDGSKTIVNESDLDESEIVQQMPSDDVKDAQERDQKGKGKEIVHIEKLSPEAMKENDENEEYVDYSNGWLLSTGCYAVWVVIVVANGYLLVTLAID